MVLLSVKTVGARQAFIQRLRELDAACAAGGEFVFRLPDGKEAGRARSVGEFSALLSSAPEESVLFHAQGGHFSAWLAGMRSGGTWQKFVASAHAEAREAAGGPRPGARSRVARIFSDAAFAEFCAAEALDAAIAAAVGARSPSQ